VTVETVIGDDAPPPPPPASGCTYDAAAKSVRATLAAGGAGTLVVAGTELRFGSPAVACGGATTTNTDTILVTGASGSVERLTVDLSGGLFAPGATSESSGVSEIEISLLLGDVTDVVVVTGSAGADSVSIGSTGMSFTSDGDGDVSMSPLPGAIEVLGLDGADTLSGKGGAGTGTDFPNKLVLHGGDGADALTGGSAADELYGGPGNDVLSGRDGNDKVDGGADNDSVAGNVGDDELIGGPGVDALIGSDGDDLLRGDDDEADTNLNGGPGTDTAHYDAGIDPAPVATEIEIAA
jgi:Ca2+-binding RTX toxin-like protein